MTNCELREADRLGIRFAPTTKKVFYNRSPQPTFCLPFCLMV